MIKDTLIDIRTVDYVEVLSWLGPRPTRSRPLVICLGPVRLTSAGPDIAAPRSRFPTWMQQCALAIFTAVHQLAYFYTIEAGGQKVKVLRAMCLPNKGPNITQLIRM
jgi:hypothetical protein